jgi:hypothetical protein
MCEDFESFEATYGVDAARDILECICEAHACNAPDQYGVKFYEIHAHDRCNHTLTGEIAYQSRTYYFVVESGNWNGTVVCQFSSDDTRVLAYEPEAPLSFDFVPTDDNLETRNPAMYSAYLAWKRAPWFIEKLQAYHYDRHVQPGYVVETHYAQWAASKGLKIVVKADSGPRQETPRQLPGHNANLTACPQELG